MKYAGPIIFLALIMLVGLTVLPGCATTKPETQIEIFHDNSKTLIA